MKIISHKISFALLLFTSAMLLASGCTMAPRYERPEQPVPEAFPDFPEFKGVDKPAGQSVTGGGEPEEVKPAEDERPSSLIPWKEFFTDPTLKALIDIALEHNRDLRIALLNVEKLRATYQIQRADLLPTINASGANSNQRIPAEFAAPSPDPVISRSTAVSVGFTAFELDIFGRVRSLKDAALERYFAQQHTAYSAQMSIIAEVASTYLQLVSYKELYQIAQDSYTTRLKSLELTQNKFDQGLASQLALNQAQTAVQEARVSAVQYKTAMLTYENALRFLIGAPIPENINIASRVSEVTPFKDLPAGLPSSLLERRPDILAAEHTLKGANANIGAARANFFPKISLTGSLGFMSSEIDNLFKNPAKTWAFAPQATLPIFDLGRNLAGLDVADADKKIAVASYEKAIQNGFREVADALAQRSTIQEQLDAAKALLDATQDSYDISSLRYEVGLDSFLNVLDSQRALFGAQQSYINAEVQKQVNSLNLYKALGGGWE